MITLNHHVNLRNGTEIKSETQIKYLRIFSSSYALYNNNYVNKYQLQYSGFNTRTFHTQIVFTL